MDVADLGLPVDVPSTALFTDQYELTMLQAALRAGTAERRSVFEGFTRPTAAGPVYRAVPGPGALPAGHPRRRGGGGGGAGRRVTRLARHPSR